ncbi:MAG: ankyrin repeat domain-containing protein [Solirubrobacteraceae bacterium]
MSRPLVPMLTDATVTVGAWLDQQVELLREAHRRADPVAVQLLRGTGVVPVSEDESLSVELGLQTARLAVARDHGYGDWADALGHAHLLVDTRFELAADAIQWGELETLRELLDAHPALVQMRSPFVHRATLLHHVAANGIEVERQLQSPPNAAEIMRLLLEHGAEPDASCDTYGGGRAQTTLYLLVSSCVPAARGVQATLVEELCNGGARVDGLDDDGLPLWTAITFGYPRAAEALGRCGARVDNIVFAAALGDLEAVKSDFDSSGNLKPQRARSAERIGVGGPALEPDRLLDYALIWAAAHDRREVVEFLLGKGPDLTFTEPCFGSTAAGAARYHGHRAMVARLEPLTARD